MTGAPTAGYRREPGMPASAVPAPLREIGFDQQLDEPCRSTRRSATKQGRTVRLGDYFGSRPVVLAFVYYDCPMLCTQILNRSRARSACCRSTPGKDFEIVTVSFDPRETPALAAREEGRVSRSATSGPAPRRLALPDRRRPSIERLTRAAGFRYVWDEETQQFAHPAGIIVADA